MAKNKNKNKRKELPKRPNKSALMKMDKEEIIDVLFAHMDLINEIKEAEIKEINEVKEAEMKEIKEELVDLINKYQAKMDQYELEKYNKYIGQSEKIETIVINEVEASLEVVEKETKKEKNKKKTNRKICK